MKKLQLSNLVLGIWLMISPFVLAAWNRSALEILWEDLLLGFGILVFSIFRIYSERGCDVAIADWIITILAVLTLINPLLYSYQNVRVAVWNNLTVGAVVFLLALLQDRRDANVVRSQPQRR